MPCCTFATSKQAWLEELLNGQGLPPGRRGFRVTAAEPNCFCCQKMQDSERSLSTHLARGIGPLKSHCRQTSFPGGYCTCARCHGQNIASCPARAGSGSDVTQTLPVPSLSTVPSKQHSKEHFLFNLSNIPVSCINPPCHKDGRMKVSITCSRKAR